MFRNLFFLIFIFTVSVYAQQNNNPKALEMLLWPKGAPHAKGDNDKDKPSLTIYHVSKDKSTGTAVVVCPGGGYGHLAMDHEGHEVAKWFNSFGVSAFVLKYRHSEGGYSHPVPMLDVQRALRLVRYKAKEWSIDPERIGVMGFSAGGHLASTAGTHFTEANDTEKDPVDRVSSRPDFMILMYPVISMNDEFTHHGSKRNLLGENPDQELVKLMSNELQVTARTPPTFIVHANDDTAVVPENSIMFYLALREFGIPVEMHIYRRGEHGFGIGRDVGPASSWPEICRQWMQDFKLLEKPVKPQMQISNPVK